MDIIILVIFMLGLFSIIDSIVWGKHNESWKFFKGMMLLVTGTTIWALVKCLKAA